MRDQCHVRHRSTWQGCPRLERGNGARSEKQIEWAVPDDVESVRDAVLGAVRFSGAGKVDEFAGGRNALAIPYYRFDDQRVIVQSKLQSVYYSARNEILPNGRSKNGSDWLALFAELRVKAQVLCRER